MDISDIILNEQTGKVEITFCDEGTNDDIVTVKISKDVAWQIHEFCQNSISYATQLKKKR